MVVCMSGLVRVQRSRNAVADMPSSNSSSWARSQSCPTRRALPGARCAAGYAAADDDAGPGLGGGGDGRFVFGLEGRVRDLQDVKHAHRDVVDEVRQGGGTAHEAHLAGVLEIMERLDGAFLFQHRPGRAEVELDNVEVVGLQAPQALVHGVNDVLPAVIVQPGQWDTEARALDAGRTGSHPADSRTWRPAQTPAGGWRGTGRCALRPRRNPPETSM